MIRYRDGYKYQLLQTSINKLGFAPPKDIFTEFISFRAADGVLSVRQWYAWDGPSGPTIDTKDFMHGSLVHDALYQLMREGHLPLVFKDLADKELHRLCLEDGMSRLRAWYVYQAVRLFGMGSAKPQVEPAIEAP